MSTVRHPGDLAPALPEVELTPAPGWAQVVAGRDLLRVTKGDSILTVAVVTGPAGTDPAQVLRDRAEADSHRAGFTLDPIFELEIDARPWLGCNATWDGPGVSVTLVATVDRAAVRQIVLVTGVAGGTGIEADYDQIQEMAESIQLVVPS